MSEAGEARPGDEQALRESKERLDFALEVAGLGQWDLNLEDHTAFRSLRHDQIFGYASLLPEWTYEAFLEHVLPEDRAAVDEQFQHALQHGEDWDFQCRIRRADGAVRWIWARGRIWRAEGGEPHHMLGTIADVTEQKRTEEALRESEARFRGTFENAAVGIAHVDKAGRWIYVNGALCRMLGYTREELLQRTFRDVSHPDDVAVSLDRFRRLMQGDVAEYVLEKRYLQKNGHAVWVHLTVSLQRDAAGEPEYNIAVIEDITEQKRTEEALRESEARFRGTFENAAVGIALVGMDGAWLHVNEKLCEIVGYAREELQEKTFQDITHPEDLEAALELFGRLVRGEIDSYQIEKRYFHKEGHVVWIELTTALQRDDQGKPLYRISIVQDISARMWIEAELVEAKERAEEMARLKSAFLANMSHEIRTPLTGILGFASLLVRHVPEKQRRYAERIETAGQRLLETLNAVLMLAKLEADRVEMEREPLRVAEEIEEIVQFFRSSAKAKGLRLLFRRDGPGAAEAEALLDRGAFVSTLQNLISNAIKFTDTGHVTVTVAAGETSGEAERRVHVHVEDTGIGIDVAFLPYLFEEFRQESSGMNRSHEGTGLGLALAKRLAEQMGGTLEVQSEKGRGSRFTLSFPLFEGNAASPAEGTPMETPETHAPTRLLIVEDNADAQFLMRDLLEDAYAVTLVTNAEEALAAARCTRHDLVLLDIHLGRGAGGEAVLAALRAMPAYRDAPIVALTAHGLPGDRERFLAKGFTDYLAKPFDVDTLLEFIVALLAR